VGTAPDQRLVSVFSCILGATIFRSSARDTAHVFPLGYELLIIHSCPCFCMTRMGLLYLSYAIGNSFPFSALHRSNVQWQLLLRSTRTLMLTIRICPSRSELSHVKKGEQTHVCTSLEMLLMITSKGTRVYVVEQPLSCGHGVQKPRYRALLEPT
jgi:hypothetical protein